MDEFSGSWEVVVIDLVEDPGAAEADRILTAPILIRDETTPRRRRTGDLSDISTVLSAPDFETKSGRRLRR